MNHSTPKGQHVVVLGGGLAGLSAAEQLVQQRSPSKFSRVSVIEASGRFGGVIETVREDGWLVERSADSFLASRPEGIALVHRLGLEEMLISVAPSARRALVWCPDRTGRGGRLVPVPSGFRLLAPSRSGPLLTTPLLSWRGRLRAVAERFVPARRSLDDESLESFAVRRLGREAFDRLVQPLVSGIWTADPARLSMNAACPDFLAFERNHGSLTRGEQQRLRVAGLLADASGARYGQFVSFQNGMQTLTTGLLTRLQESGVKLVSDRVESLQRNAAGWQVNCGREEPIQASAVVVATPAFVASRLLAAVHPSLAADLAAIEYAGAAVVSLGFQRDKIDHPLDAAGMIVPRIAGRRLVAASFSSIKFPNRAPVGSVLMRGFIGGALDPSAAELPDDELANKVLSDLRDMLCIRGQPQYGRIDRWHTAVPQYNLCHVDRVRRISAAEKCLPGLGLAGAAYRGVGIPQVIQSGQEAALRAIGQSENSVAEEGTTT